MRLSAHRLTLSITFKIKGSEKMFNRTTKNDDIDVN